MPISAYRTVLNPKKRKGIRSRDAGFRSNGQGYATLPWRHHGLHSVPLRHTPIIDRQ